MCNVIYSCVSQALKNHLATWQPSIFSWVICCSYLVWDVSIPSPKLGAHWKDDWQCHYLVFGPRAICVHVCVCFSLLYPAQNHFVTITLKHTMRLSLKNKVVLVSPPVLSMGFYFICPICNLIKCIHPHYGSSKKCCNR